MQFNGIIDSSVFECLVSKDESYRVLPARELNELYPKSYELIREIGKILGFATDDADDVTPLGEAAEQMFKIIESAILPTQFMDMLTTVITRASTLFTNWQDDHALKEVGLIPTKSNTDKMIFAVTDNVRLIVEKHSRKLLISLV